MIVADKHLSQTQTFAIGLSCFSHLDERDSATLKRIDKNFNDSSCGRLISFSEMVGSVRLDEVFQ
jgi:hypothetical protein